MPVCAEAGALQLLNGGNVIVFCTAQDVWRDLPYDYSTLMENVLDSRWGYIICAPSLV